MSTGCLLNARAWLLPLGIVLLVSCHPNDPNAAGSQRTHRNAAKGLGGGTARGDGTAPSRRPIPVEVRPARRGTIAAYYQATTTLEVERSARVPARVSGLIKSIEVEEDDEVAAGAVLLELENEEYRLLFNKAEATAENLEAKLARLQEISQNLVSAEELGTAKKDLAAARAEEGLARLNLSYTQVVAPFGGRVVQRYVDVGQFVSAGTDLFEIADFNPLLARVHIPAKEFRKIQTDQEVELYLDSDVRSNPVQSQTKAVEPLKGTITIISPTIDPSTGTIKVTIEIPSYPEDTRPGDFAEVRIVTERRQGSILVPRKAVFKDKGDPVVYVASEDRAVRRVVEVGFTDQSHAEILRGVEVDESVVVRGQRSLKDGSPVKVMQRGLSRSEAKSHLMSS